MRAEGAKSKTDEIIVSNFLNGYCGKIGLPWRPEDLKVPDKDSQTPSDRRIDAIYPVNGIESHLEHTSVDLITSNGKNKRSLDPGFLLLEQALKSIACPDDRGLRVTLPLQYAQNISSLKQIIPAVKNQVETYLARLQPSDWEKYPSDVHRFYIDARQFAVRPYNWLSGEVSLEWSGGDDNFLEPNNLEICIKPLLEQKLAKLDNSLSHTDRPAYGIVLVNTQDVAAQSFHSFSGVFARIIKSADAGLSELWGLHGTNTTPTLAWYDTLDSGRTDCPYRDNTDGKSYAEIEDYRTSQWRRSRNLWLQENGAAPAKASNA